MTQQEALVVFNAIAGVTPVVFKKLISAFGSAADALSGTQEEFLELGMNPNLVLNIVHFPKDKFLEAEYNLVRKKGVEVVTILDQDYPDVLRSIPLAPNVLYIKGNSKVLGVPAVALVGARKASQYGLKIAEQFAYEFAQAGLVVASGGASGVDTASHKGCLKIKGKTMAVLGCGLMHVYPASNKDLFEEIAQEGAVISEFPMDTEPFPYNFPRRNRIISGLSLATVVIEAAEKSGSLITADYANGQNKEVFAVPGNIDSSYSQGTNRLIKDGAKIAFSAVDVLEQLGLSIKNQIEQERKEDKSHVVLSVEEYKIYELIEYSPEHIDDLCSRCGCDIGTLMGQMLNLELKGVVKQLPGQFYVRV